jgi:hypothetical protein
VLLLSCSEGNDPVSPVVVIMVQRRVDNAPPSTCRAVLLTHDNREWSKAGGYMTYLHLWNFLYSQRHGDKVHFLYYWMLKGDIQMEPVGGTYRGEAAVKSMNRLLPLEYQVFASTLFTFRTEFRVRDSQLLLCAFRFQCRVVKITASLRRLVCHCRAGEPTLNP